MIYVACAIVVDGTKVLVTQRSIKMTLPLKWEFPGGKIEQNETAEECVIREIKEELNIHIHIIAKLIPKVFNYGSFEIELSPFVSNLVSGEVKLAEHSQFKWMEFTELSNLDWAPADIPVLDDLLKMNYHARRII